ncbi:PEP-CTERM sorting domain-containing protein [Herbaspirillum sp. SJZ107]|uniref:PEP-CTERM sorting domain-containing protein n=1 Tax=Herbaspirillum sp. SJZ107 TaxID=2572881 RepID=UPI0011500B1B|nr:PEP-CTERM sorting domain-containing protein [Herbaspirillum sp. SJZ107]TQK10230.1 putative secreted protein with PEP-CTERM sorting signal [Herbaspirillum sp. SJZ107]
MKPGILACVAAAVMGVTSLASATAITIDFEEFAYGTAIGDYYAGGKDSLNRASGPNYGLTFNGPSTIKNTPSGAYLAGFTYLTIDPNVVKSILKADAYYISFNAGVYGFEERGIYARFESGLAEQNAYVSGNGSPDCGSHPDTCYRTIYQGQMGGYYVGQGYGLNDSAVSLTFPVDRLDNIQIHSYDASTTIIRPGIVTSSYETGRDIPEPATLGLLSIGAAALAFRSRSRKSIAQPKKQA